MNFDDPDSSMDFDEDVDEQKNLNDMLVVQKRVAEKSPKLRERLYLHAKEALKFGTI